MLTLYTDGKATFSTAGREKLTRRGILVVEEAISRLEHENGHLQHIAVQADVGKEAGVQRLFKETHQAFGAINTGVNNAGVFHLLTNVRNSTILLIFKYKI